ncbi:TPA: carbohydrate-binding protein CenC [Serratia odorifera]|nr:carbohydrate-binding protein CenC [Serratia odorifera]
MSTGNPYRALLLASCWLAAGAQANVCAPNLLINPGFEQGAQAWRSAGARVVAAGRGGGAALYYRPSPAEGYHTFSQRLSVQPGQTIDFGAWIRVHNVRGATGDNGASVYLQSFDAQGRFLEGSYPRGVSGSADWQPIRARYTVPAQAARVTLGVYLRRYSSGEAWFDDLYACVRPPQPALYPLGVGQNGNAQTLIEVASAQRVQVDSRLLDRQGRTIKSSSQRLQIDKRHRLQFDLPPALPAGEYRLRQQVTATMAPQGPSSEVPLELGLPAAAVSIDADGFTRKAGQRIFPLGIYADITSERHLARIAAAGFNSVLNYNYGNGKDPYGFFRRAQRQGLQVIYSLKDLYPGSRFAPPTRSGYPALAAWQVMRLKGQPNLLAWYINDELGPEYLGQIVARQRQIRRLDRDHPTFQVLNKTADLDAYYHGADILATDPYPVGVDDDLTRTTRYTALTVQAARRVKGAWVVIQIMDHAAYDPRRRPHQPNEDEIRSQAWQALIGGANGLLFYSYTDLFYRRQQGRLYPQAQADSWRGVAAVALQIKSFTPYLLSGRRLTPIGSNPAIPARIFADQRRALLLVTNPFYRPVTLRLQLPAGWHHQGATTLTLSLPAVGSRSLWLNR